MKCWDGSHVYDLGECPEFFCNIDTYFALPPCDNAERNFRNCSCPWQQCERDGVWVADKADCAKEEARDTRCWDGSYAVSFFECRLPDIFCTDDCEAIPTHRCWDDSYVENDSFCPLKPDYECWDG